MVKTIKKYNISKKFTEKKGRANSGNEGCLEKTYSSGGRIKKIKKNKKKTFKINKKMNKYKKSLKKHRGGCNDADFWANLHLHI